MSEETYLAHTGLCCQQPSLNGILPQLPQTPNDLEGLIGKKREIQSLNWDSILWVHERIQILQKEVLGAWALRLLHSPELWRKRV